MTQLDMFSEYPADPVIASVIGKFKGRADEGMKKYGVAMTRTDIDLKGWLKHLQEELMDGVNYIERILQELENKK